MRAQFVLSEIWIGLRRNLTMTVAVIVTVAISLALFGGGLLINQQVTQMRQYWDERVTLTVYMCTDISTSNACQENGAATDQQRQDVQNALESMDEVSSVEYISAEDAFKDFQERFANNEAMVEAVREGDIPDNFRVQLVDPSQYEAVSSNIEGSPGIDSIYDDQAVLEQFFGLLDGLTAAALTVAFVQLAAAALLIGNTVRLAAYSRRKETGIMRLVGASNFYIQLPFLLEGAIAGLIGGIIASGFIVAARFLLLSRIQEWFQFDVTLSTGSLLSVIGVSLILGVLLCTVASFLTLRRYLRV
ncbi:permease-like cell division protein FtsX [Streptomonospora nanhaiensis]|uniref:Cell division protein FtsX n=1 Tax=Streptomonospora nanhaiensis TaxID=1323731 RepID=A0A853BKL6_9ACTN|nr:permease-like cell division protein FtsX [Streptomonospora nanhaiensis]MBV2362122.1 permease-like cell division protein FtsX [Streptomonospora nanhaiensis]MBV2364806.1 permease-like cell division protein FtsX [Streptomonospora nanhaiensis]MBX9388575.1 permease-like cell division protein FtsX [Streptomonospora nanhaiensis]NYI96049.1 cell division transport system permease protein [Streptomonospora nanhaiensis]